MKFTPKCDDCHCCDIPDVDYPASFPIVTTNTAPPSDGHTLELFGLTDDSVSLPDLFDVEAFCFGGTLNSWNISSRRARLDDTSTEKKLHPGMHVTLSVDGSQFTAGVRLWPKTAITISPSTDYDNERLISLISSVLARHLVDHNFTPGQYYDTFLDIEGGPSADHALPFFGIVAEQSGSLFYRPKLPLFFTQCFRLNSAGLLAPTAFHPRDGRQLDQATGEFVDSSAIDRHCYPDPAPANITRVGLLAGLSTWIDFDNGFTPGATDYTPRPVPTGTHTLSAHIAGPQLRSSYREECQCFFRDELTLTATFPNDQNLNTRPEAQGLVITLTRAAGESEYTGSVTLPVTGAFCAGEPDIDIDLSFDPSDDCREIRLTCSCPTADCLGTVMQATLDDPFTNLDPINVRYQANVGPVTWTLDLTL